jgi:hypothetical protein
MDMFEKFKYKESEFEDLDYNEEREVWGKLKILEEIATYIDAMRESYTRHLVVNGAGECKTDEDFKKRWGEIEEEQAEKLESPVEPIIEEPIDEDITTKYLNYEL